MAKKTTKRKAVKKTAKRKTTTKRKVAKKSVNDKYNFLTVVYDGVLKHCEVTRTGTIRLKRADLKTVLEDAFLNGARAAAAGQRVRFPVIGAIVRKEVKARKAGKGVNPFTGEPMTIKARPASKKPRWSFPKTLKDTFANKRYW